MTDSDNEVIWVERWGPAAATLRWAAVTFFAAIIVGCGPGGTVPSPMSTDPSNIAWSQFIIQTIQPDRNTSGGGYVILSDLDLDGDLDAASGFASSDAVAIHIKDATQGWDSRIIARGFGSIQSLAAKDLAQSTQIDLVAATDTGRIVLMVAPVFARSNDPWQISVFSNPRAVAAWNDVKIVQLDNLEGSEIIAVSSDGNIIGLWHSSSRPRTAGDYQAFVAVQLPAGGFERLTTIDIDKDGDLDIVAVGPGGGIIWLENRGPTNIFSSWLVFRIANRTGLTRLVAADIDDDGDLDLACTDPSTGRVFWYENFGNPRFDLWPERLVADLLPGKPDAISAVDIDENGKLDLLVGTESPDGKIYWLRPQGEPRQLWRSRLIDNTGFEVGELPTGQLDERAGIDFATTLAGSGTPVIAHVQN